MPIVGGLDIHRKQITFDYLDTATREVRRGQITPADRKHIRAWLGRFAGRGDVAFALEGCTGWRYIAEELAAAGALAAGAMAGWPGVLAAQSRCTRAAVARHPGATPGRATATARLVSTVFTVVA
jgi:transposase